jgi:excisionase family DNA binding protein
MFANLDQSVPLRYHYQQQHPANTGVRWRPMTPSQSESVCRDPGTRPHSTAMTKSAIAPTNLRWLTTEEVCERLGITPDTLSKWKARGCAPAWKRLPNGSHRTREDWLDQFMNELPGEAA